MNMDDYNEERFAPDHNDIIRDIAKRTSSSDRVDREFRRDIYSRDNGKSIARLNFGLLCFLLGVFILAYVYFYLPNDSGNNVVVNQNSAVSDAEEKQDLRESKEESIEIINDDKPKHKGIKVYVVGEVKNPGIFSLPFDSRVDDAISAAGGLTDKAEPLSINLAKRIKDEDKIFVCPKGEDSSKSAIGNVTKSGVIEPREDEEPLKDTKISRNNEISNKDECSDLIDINTATEEELQKIPGVGPSISKSIVEHRQKLPDGKFTQKSQLKDVAGIGKSNYKKIEPHVDVR
ncbi:helix-hairpin-helix domain-containing protein [bacterium]|nr:helix-hairpin-helix domain-containing protein [bacterium]